MEKLKKGENYADLAWDLCFELMDKINNPYKYNDLVRDLWAKKTSHKNYYQMIKKELIK